MRKAKTYFAGEAMVTALGAGVAHNVACIEKGESGLRVCTDPRVTQGRLIVGEIPDLVYDSLWERFGYNWSRAEVLAIGCINEIVSELSDEALSALNAENTILVLATAKGNIDALPDTEAASIPAMTARIAAEFGLSRTISVSNACISGGSALTVAKRLIEEGSCSNAIVCGVEVQSRFISSGFVSFKSLSDKPCRPYDAARDGLNIGEGCGALLLVSDPAFARRTPGGRAVVLAGGAISDDANHISGPSRTGDGLFFAMRNALKDAGLGAQEIDLLQMHGTATVYNDEMESKAVGLAGMQEVPVQSLKGYYGHCMGASCVIETILCAEQIRRGEIFATKGFETLGVPVGIKIVAETRPAGLRSVLKTASGFGGCNVALVLSSEEVAKDVERPAPVETEVAAETEYHGTEGFAELARAKFRESEDSKDIRLAAKFSKMDNLSKLGLIAAADIMKGVECGEEELGVILCGRHSSMDTDLRHHELISKGGDSAASPAVFVYTLPNVAAGEIAIRYKAKGEETFFLADSCDEGALRSYAATAMGRTGMKYCICGWLDFYRGEYFAKFELLKRS